MGKTIVALDCMGGDNAPKEIVKGGVEAINANDGIKVCFVGKEKIVQEELSNYTFNEDQFEVIDASEVIETGEPPVEAIRNKKDSSMVKCMQMVRDGRADAMVSAGSSGANLVGGHVIIGRLKGVERPPLASIIPTNNGVSMLIDSGANVDARPSHLVQFARMGTVYMENIIGIKNPRVAIVNIGEEEEKGNALVKETYPILSSLSDINFVGNIESRDIPAGAADVIVCDAFVGNVILKMYEGVGAMLIDKVTDTLKTNLKTKIGGLLIKKNLKKTLRTFSVEDYGGAPLLGLKGLLVKTHGNSKAIEVKNSIIQCESFKEMDLNHKFQEALAKGKE